VGPEIVATLTDSVTELAGIPLFTNMQVIEILVANGAVDGVVVADRTGREYTISAPTVVMATGGFGANNELVAEYDPSLRGFGTTNHAGATGDGIALLEAVDALFIDMTEIQTHPTVVPAGQMITEAVRGNGAIMVGRAGSRFVDELGTRDVVSQAILSQDGGTAYLVFDQAVRESLRAIESYVSAGLVTEGETLAALAASLEIPSAAMEEAVARYNGIVASGTDADFGRSNMARPIQVAPFYAIEVAPAVHHTMGGVAINANAEVLNRSEQPIAGLYAAGEVTGGVHGGNRLGGNALADIVTFGRIAGRNAAQYAARTAGR
jgi:fumarate reductase flavoprotein subunit